MGIFLWVQEDDVLALSLTQSLTSVCRLGKAVGPTTTSKGEGDITYIIFHISFLFFLTLSVITLRNWIDNII